jgi:hypothetical protein
MKRGKLNGKVSVVTAASEGIGVYSQSDMVLNEHLTNRCSQPLTVFRF